MIHLGCEPIILEIVSLGVEAESLVRGAKALAQLVRLPTSLAAAPSATEFAWWGSGPLGLVYLMLFYGLFFGAAKFWARQKRTLNLAMEEELEARTSQLMESNESKTRFIESMNHEIRNPINGIVGITRILSDQAGDPKTKMLLTALGDCTDRLQATMSGVMDFNAIERGHFDVETVNFDIVELVRSTAGLNDDSRGEIVLPEVLPDPVWCHGDAGKIRLILGNYISNARKYGAPARAEIGLQVIPLSSREVRFLVSVKSPGAGLMKEELSSLFKEYYRGARARQTQAVGTGLGLSICRRYAEAMGGEVGASSNINSNTFWLELTLPIVSEEIESMSASSTGSIRALAVEDEAYNRLVLGHYLRELGVDVDWADSAGSAEDRISENDYDIIFTDCSITDAQDDEVVRRLRGISKIDGVPIVVISGHSTAAVRNRVLAAGAVDFVSKPVSSDRLRRCLVELGFYPDADRVDGVHADGDRAPFSHLLNLGAAHEVLPTFLADLEKGFHDLEEAIRAESTASAGLAHQFRSALLLAGRTEAERLIARLESDLSSDRRETSSIAFLMRGLAQQLRIISRVAEPLIAASSSDAAVSGGGADQADGVPADKPLPNSS